MSGSLCGAEKKDWKPDPEVTAMIASNPELIGLKLDIAMRKQLENPASLTIEIDYIDVKSASVGKLARVFIDTSRGQADGLVLHHAKTEFLEVQLDTTKLIKEEKIDTISVKSINMDVIILEPDLNAFLADRAAKIRVRNPAVQLGTDSMRLSGSTKYGIMRVDFWAEGSLSVKDRREIWFHARKMKLNRMTMPRAFVGSIVRKINPILDLQKLPFQLNLEEILVKQGMIQFTSFKNQEGKK